MKKIKVSKKTEKYFEYSLRSLVLNEQGVSNRGPNLKSVF